MFLGRISCSVWRIMSQAQLPVFALDPVGNSSPVAQKGTRSNYKSTRIFKSPFLNKFYFLGCGEYCLLNCLLNCLLYCLLPVVLPIVLPGVIPPLWGNQGGGGGERVLSSKNVFFPKKVLPRRCLSKRFSHQKKTLVPKKVLPRRCQSKKCCLS